MKARKLKVYGKLRRRTWDEIVVPEIRLEGKWLESIGLEQGKEIKVETKKGKLIITVLKNEKSA